MRDFNNYLYDYMTHNHLNSIILPNGSTCTLNEVACAVVEQNIDQRIESGEEDKHKLRV